MVSQTICNHADSVVLVEYVFGRAGQCVWPRYYNEGVCICMYAWLYDRGLAAGLFFTGERLIDSSMDGDLYVLHTIATWRLSVSRDRTLMDRSLLCEGVFEGNQLSGWRWPDRRRYLVPLLNFASQQWSVGPRWLVITAITDTVPIISQWIFLWIYWRIELRVSTPKSLHLWWTLYHTVGLSSEFCVSSCRCLEVD